MAEQEEPKTAADALRIQMSVFDWRVRRVIDRARLHRKKGDDEPGNWGYSESMKKVNADLLDILEFLGG